MASSAKERVEFRADAPRPENKGAGGNGLLGLPPYLEEGVPGLGLPFKSAGSNCIEGGGLPNSLDPLDGVHDLVGEDGLAEKGLYEESGGGTAGRSSTIDGALECDEMTVG